MARPRKDFNTIRRQVQRMATLGMSRAEIAHVLGISERTLARRKLDLAMQKGRAHLQQSIRLAQIKAAVIDKSPALLIWLGKQLLEQREPPQGLELSGKIEHELTPPDELRAEVLRRLARLAQPDGAGGDLEDAAAEIPPRTGNELRLLGPGESAGADG